MVDAQMLLCTKAVGAYLPLVENAAELPTRAVPAALHCKSEALT